MRKISLANVEELLKSVTGCTPAHSRNMHAVMYKHSNTWF